MGFDMIRFAQCQRGRKKAVTSLITVEEMAGLLDIPVKQAEWLIRSGLIRGFKIRNSGWVTDWRWLIEALEEANDFSYLSTEY